MDDLHKMQSDLEKVIEKDDCSTVTNDSDETSKPKTVREKLDVFIHSNKFMVGVVVLVVLDCIMVIAELLFDLEIVKLGEEHKYVPKIFHYASLAILSLFLIEISIRVYVLRLAFFKHKLEVLDAIVVIVSFVLDIVFRNNEDASTGIGLLILLRLWRVTRIVNGIVLSVKTQAEKKVQKERQLREACEQELAKFREYCTAQETEIESLQELLRKHNIDFSVKKISRPEYGTKIDVVAEVNHVADHINQTTIVDAVGQEETSHESETNVKNIVV